MPSAGIPCLGRARGLGAVQHQHQLARAGRLVLFGNQRIRLAAAGYFHLVEVAEDGAVYTHTPAAMACTAGWASETCSHSSG
jgi:hypothetical protein